MRRPVCTYSIVARDPESGQMGVAVQSHWFSVGQLAPWAVPGVGAIVTQSFVKPEYGPRGLEMLRGGHSARETLRLLLAEDSGASVRQVAMVDSGGDVAVHTGAQAVPEAGHHIGAAYSTQANLMRKRTVWHVMAEAYESSTGDLADRFMAALRAAQAEGGDIRGRKSAAMLIVADRDRGIGWKDRPYDLRVDDHEEPVKELGRLVELQRAYLCLNQGDEYLAKGENEAALDSYDCALQLLPDAATNGETAFWVGVAMLLMRRDEEALAYLKRAHRQHEDWAELLPRLVHAGLLPDEPERIRRLSTGMRGN